MASRSFSKFGRELRDILLNNNVNYLRRYQEPRKDGFRIKFYQTSGEGNIDNVVSAIKKRWPRLEVRKETAPALYGREVVNIIIHVKREAS